MSDNVIHWQVGGLIGTGAVSTRNGNNTGRNDIIFILEPGADAVLNITSTIRFAAGLSYRFVSGVDPDNFNEYLKNSDLSNLTASLTLLFGSFLNQVFSISKRPQIFVGFFCMVIKHDLQTLSPLACMSRRSVD